jgi:hypothetical protein
VIPGYPIQLNGQVLPDHRVGLITATDTDPRLSYGKIAVPPLPHGWGSKSVAANKDVAQVRAPRRPWSHGGAGHTLELLGARVDSHPSLTPFVTGPDARPSRFCLSHQLPVERDRGLNDCNVFKQPNLCQSRVESISMLITDSLLDHRLLLSSCSGQATNRDDHRVGLSDERRQALDALSSRQSALLNPPLNCDNGEGDNSRDDRRSHNGHRRVHASSVTTNR